MPVRHSAGSGRDVSPLTKAARATAVFARLREVYPDAHCELNYGTPFELLIATILSAQCTDKRVNQVTPALFHRAPDAAAVARMEQAEVERLVHSTGFYRNKAKNIIACAQVLMERHGGDVPREMELLRVLPGVGRKTANVVLGNAYGLNEGVVVDTHIARLSKRLGFTRQSDPVKIEKDLVRLFPQKDWTLLAHLLIWHGRRRCSARRPDCSGCEVRQWCPSADSAVGS
jgi:endonuclease-3